MKKLSRSRALAAKVIYEALLVLKENGGELPGRDIVEQVGTRVEFSDWEKARYEKSGYIRWQSVLHLFSIDCTKAGFLIKKKGVWYLTPEGEKALELGPVQLLEAASKGYRQWKGETKTKEQPEMVDADADSDRQQEAQIDEIEQIALDGLIAHIKLKNPYEFQDLAAALLRGAGYYTPFVAPKGKDGGIDIIAYRDPLGTISPRIKVQVKHREQSATVQEIRQLMGLLQKDGDVGIFISTGGFTVDAKRAARGSHIHVELINLERFIALWQEFYPKLTDEDKNLLPLTPIFFYAPS